MKRELVVTTLCLMTSIWGFGQEKGLRKRNVPEAVQVYIRNEFPEVKRVKYFTEYEMGNHYIEADLCSNETQFSLKFLNDSLVETEINIALSAIPDSTRQQIMQNLQSQFTHFKIVEIQKIVPDAEANYELFVKLKSGNSYELFYDRSGNLVRKTEMSLKPIPSQF